MTQRKCEIANTLFQNKRYAEALRIYHELERKYGPNFTRINAQLCREHLANILSTPQHKSSDLDPITRLMLDNAEKKLSTEQRAALEKLVHCCLLGGTELLPQKPVSTPTLPNGLELSPLPESTNDYVWSRQRRINAGQRVENAGLSIIVPTYNRAKILSITLASLVNQRTEFPYEVIVADDGSRENIQAVVESFQEKLDITWAWQEDDGYRLSAVRNLGMSVAKYPYLAILDCDMAPCVQWVETYMNRLLQDDECAYIGPRRYKDTATISSNEVLQNPSIIESLPDVLTNNSVAGSVKEGISVDWRLEHTSVTDNLRLCNNPFRFFSGGNVAFAKKWLERVGGFDENFNHWGGEDGEFGYRLYRAGCFFEFDMSALAFHQEPPGKENETDREAGQEITKGLLYSKAPYFYRKRTESPTHATIKEKPLISIYIPAYNCQSTLRLAIESALSQTVTDLEVCICDDGSTDGTRQLLDTFYAEHPRVKFISQRNSGIGAASNTAIRMCQGYYIGQLDSDDFLEPNAVEISLKAFLENPKLVCVYTTYRNILKSGESIPGYNWPEFSREKLMETMICHHFRMFTIRAWNLTAGFDEDMTNAVDYDMFLKLSEVGEFHHINTITYNRYLHTENTSITNKRAQMENHLNAINASLNRQHQNNFICKSASLENNKFKPILVKTD